MDFKKILKPFIIIPNLPCLIILLIYLIINLCEHTGFAEMQDLDEEDVLTDELKEHIIKIYPKHFRYAVAIVFYISLGFKIYVG